MSTEDTERISENKLMDILEEELSGLKLRGESTDNENGCLKDNLPEEREVEIVEEKEDFSSSSDKTAEILQETGNDRDEVECKENKALNPPTENVAGKEILRAINYQYHESEYIHKEGIFKSESEKTARQFLQQVCSNGNDKTCLKNDAQTFMPPPDNLAEKIQRRMESYFQDYNIFKNSFLLNHIRRNKKGYVSLKLVSSLRKIRALTRDSRVVAYSIKQSKILELNPESSKVRRIEPIPKIEDTSFGKTLMVFNLPQQNLSADYLNELFSKFGTVVSADVFEIGSPESNVYHQRCLHFHQKIASKIYGLVEFEMYDQVVDALKDEEGHLPKENEMKVVPLMPQIYKKERRYLKFLEPYNAKRRKGFEMYNPRDNSRNVKNEVTAASGDVMRNGKMNAGNYPFKRGFYRRPYSRGRKPFMPSNVKSYSDGQIAGDYSGITSNRWGESRQLKANNNFNIDRLYPNVHRKKTRNGYMENDA